MPAASRVGIISLGCAKNLVDTEVMLGYLDRAGFTFVREPREADIIVINTCGFIEAAREESIQAILEIAELKKSGRLKRIVVAGCMAQRYSDELSRELPEVDAFLGLDELHAIVERSSSGRSAVPQAHAAARRPATYLYDHATPRLLATNPWSAYIKIAEGCDHRCSFCAIPAFRGVFRSRRPESILAEARSLAARGVREIILIAQDSSRYGVDLKLSDGLADLLEKLDAVEELRWIRVHYLHPDTVTERLMRSMARLSKVVKYVDLPLQHGARSVLRRMRRGGSLESHLRLLERFRLAIPDVAVRSTFIAGFPGETEEEFATLLELIRQARFDHMGLFAYSHEEQTEAGNLQDDIPGEVKQERLQRAMECQQEIAFRKNLELLGRRVEVLVEGAHPDSDDLLVGRMSTQSPDVDGQVIINDGHAGPGRFVPVELTDTAGYDLVGRILDQA
jgi:ribosomal protein S12 methylthiotransferase